ncbi:MAG: lipopolysaccharide biosynthesis protein [Solirubrobacteraceae bacterium]
MGRPRALTLIVGRARALIGARGAVAGDALLTSAGSILATGIAAFTSIIIARELGPEGRGSWAVVSSIAVLTSTIVPLGLPIAVGYGIARVQSADRARLLQAGARGAVAAAAIAAFAALAVAAIARPDGVDAPTMALVGAMAAALVLHHFGQQCLLTGGTLPWYVAVQLTPVAFMLVAVVAIALAGSLTVSALSAISAASASVAAALAVAGLARHGLEPVGRLVRGARETARMLRPYLPFAMMTFATLSLTQIVHRVDVLIVAGYLGEGQAGLYAVATQVGDVLLVVPAALGVVVFRRGATATEGHWKDALGTLAGTAAFAAALAVAVGVAAAPLVRTLFGSDYEGSVEPLRWLLPGVVLLGLQGVVSNYVASRGRPGAVLVAWLTSAVFGIVADLFVVPRHGIVGAAIVSSVSYLLVLGLHVPPMRALRPGAS